MVWTLSKVIFIIFKLLLVKDWLSSRLTPEYKKAASALKGVVKVGAVNADEHRSLGGQYQVQGFPTIKIFGKNKNKPEDYQGGRDAKVIFTTLQFNLKIMKFT